jgi:crossover junction endodeoxyribonuclease RuvC
MTVLGVDIGNTGAVALIDEAGELLEVCDMQCLSDGPKGGPALNAPLLAAIVAKAGASQAYVEWVGPRPTDGAVQAFAFGRCKGVVEGVLAASGVPVAFLTPPQWKRLVGIAPGQAGAKDAARSEACRRWPGKAALFARQKDDGRAEACLIALAGLMRDGRPRGLETTSTPAARLVINDSENRRY